MTQPRRAANGCRPQQLLGLWAMEASRLREFEAQAREALRAGLVRPPSKAYDDDYEPAPKKAKPLFRVLNGMAVIEICGTMTKYESSFSDLFGGASTVRAREAVRAATRDKTIRGIFIKFDSPGGTVAGTSDLAEAVKAANAQKPTLAYIEDQGCSAAYWVASQCRKVYGNTTCVVGSIGTFAVAYDTSGMYAEAGIKVHVVSSAPLKGAGSEGQEITDEMLADWSREISELNDRFVAGFAKGRRMPIDKARGLADGRVHVGTNAQAQGLIDGVASFDAAFKELQKMANETTDKDTLDLAAEAEERAVKAEKELAETKAALATSQKEASDAKARVTALEGAKAKEADPLADLPAEARSRVEAAEKKANAALAKAEQLETEARKKEFAGQAAAFGHLPVKAEEFGEVLMECAEKLSPASYAEIWRVLKAADAAATPLFKANGSDGAATGATAEDRVEARATALVADGKAKTIQEARDIAWKEDPKLWKQHMNERRAS